MVGIQNNEPICEDEVKVECPDGRIAIGVRSDGSLRCGEPPPGSCPTAEVLLCGKSVTLFADGHGDSQVIEVSTDPGNPGGEREARYDCRDGSWRFVDDWGDPCECTPQTQAPEVDDCGSWSNCGDRFSGNQTTQRVYTCPDGDWDTITIDDSMCACDETVRTRDRSCPSGYNGGRIYEENRHDCSQDPPRCSGWQETGRDCSCTPKTDTRQRSCSGGLSGKIVEQRKFECPGGNSSPGSWTGWEETSNTCTCVPTSRTEDRDCPTRGHVGEYQVKVEFTCPDARTVETVVTNTCAPPPPVVCQWTMVGSGGTIQSTPLPTRDGSICECGSDSKACSSSLGGGQYRYGSCNCQ